MIQCGAATGDTTYALATVIQGVGSGDKHLFIDDHHIERLDGACIRYHQPVKDKRPVLLPDSPWEGDSLNWMLGGPLWCEERKAWRMWYVGGSELLPLYAESTDGLTWKKPALGLVEWNGSKENNIIRLWMHIQRGKDKRMVLLRDDHDPDPARRYKGLNRVGGRLHPMVSADGLDWHRLGRNPFPSGDEYRLCYDPLRQRFVATGKVLIETERAVTLSLSDDFVNWSRPETIFRSDATDHELGAQRIDAALADPGRRHPVFVNREEYVTDVYNMQGFVYEDLYLALASMFHRSGFWDDRVNQDGIIQPVLTASRDLRAWNRLNQDVFLPLSALSAKGMYDHASIFGSPPVRRGDELWFYYRGGSYSHMGRDRVARIHKAGEPDSAIHLARLRLDGFASVHAGEAGGTLLTKPVKISDARLMVNADAANGELRAELLDAETGNPIPGFSMNDSAPTHENGVSLPLRWQAHETLDSLRDRTVRIRLHLRNADLFAFW